MVRAQPTEGIQMNFVLLCLLGLSTTISGATAFAISPVLSVRCDSENQRITQFSFDLYATGHPMGGVTMFSGMFEAKSNGLQACGSRSVGPIDTLPSKNGKLNFIARANCLNEEEFYLIVDTEKFRTGDVYSGVLSYRTTEPLGTEPWVTQPVQCRQDTARSPHQ